MENRKRKQRSFTSRRRGRLRRVIAIVIAVAAALLIAFLLWRAFDRAHPESVAPEGIVSSTAEASGEPTGEPTSAPTSAPTSEPTSAPTADPAEAAPVNPMANAFTASAETTVEVTASPDENTGVLTGVKIGIDPGHQARGNSEQEPVAPGSSETKAKVSSGTQGVATRIPEYEVNLQISLQLRDALEALGAEVYLTHETNDVDISNIERAVMMNELGVDVVLRLHCNGSTDSSVTGIGLFVKSSGDGAEESYAISEVLIKAMGEATGAKTESIHVRDTYSGLNWSTVPSILVEMGYMSNPEEDKKLCSADYQALLTQGMVNGLVSYFAAPDQALPSAAPSDTAKPDSAEPSNG